MKITLLGTGTSSGVPLIGCTCETCTSDDPRDKRLRCSIHIEHNDNSFVVDTSSDFRQQMLQHKITNLDAVLFTHHHCDHITGFDDIRAFNFLQNVSMPIFASEITMQNLKRAFIHAFEKPSEIGGGVPAIDPIIINDDPFVINGSEFIPIELFHGSLQVYGFRIGNFAYCTDTNFIPKESLEKLRDLEVLVIDALRHEKHPTHFSLEEALATIADLKPQQSFLTHISHHLKHHETELILPEGVNVAYDGMKIEIDH